MDTDTLKGFVTARPRNFNQLCKTNPGKARENLLARNDELQAWARMLLAHAHRTHDNALVLYYTLTLNQLKKDREKIE